MYDWHRIPFAYGQVLRERGACLKGAHETPVDNGTGKSVGRVIHPKLYPRQYHSPESQVEMPQNVNLKRRIITLPLKVFSEQGRLVGLQR